MNEFCLKKNDGSRKNAPQILKNDDVEGLALVLEGIIQFHLKNGGTL